MPALTPNRFYPYSIPTDPTDIPGALQSLAEAIDDDVCVLTNQVMGRPVAQFRGTASFITPSTSLVDIAIPPFPAFFRVPFDTVDFDTIGCTMQSMEPENRLIRPNVPGFYMAVVTIYVPTITLAGVNVDFMDTQIHRGNSATPALATTRLSGASHNIGAGPDDRNVRILTDGGTGFFNGTTDSFAVEFRADTTPNVAGYEISTRTLTILRMTQS